MVTFERRVTLRKFKRAVSDAFATNLTPSSDHDLYELVKTSNFQCVTFVLVSRVRSMFTIENERSSVNIRLP